MDNIRLAFAKLVPNRAGGPDPSALPNHSEDAHGPSLLGTGDRSSQSSRQITPLKASVPRPVCAITSVDETDVPSPGNVEFRARERSIGYLKDTANLPSPKLICSPQTEDLLSAGSRRPDNSDSQPEGTASSPTQFHACPGTSSPTSLHPPISFRPDHCL